MSEKELGCEHPEHVPKQYMGCNTKKVIDILQKEWQHYKIRNLGRCWTEYTCTKCGCYFEIDSSD